MEWGMGIPKERELDRRREVCDRQVLGTTSWSRKQRGGVEHALVYYWLVQIRTSRDTYIHTFYICISITWRMRKFLCKSYWHLMFLWCHRTAN
jgi:hypothetical protein